MIGTLFLLHTLLGVQLPVRQLLPVALVALGAYMLFDYARGRGIDQSNCSLRLATTAAVSGVSSS